MPIPRRASYFDVPNSLKQLQQIRMNNTSNTPSFPYRRRSKSMERSSSESLNLDAMHIQYIFKELIPKHSTDEELIDEAFILRKMIDSLGNETSHWPCEFLENIFTVLSSFVSAVPTLLPNVVSQIHTIIGLIRQQQREYKCAIEFLQKALWIKNSLRESSTEIGMALHRLAMAYGRSGNLLQAVTLLQKALFKYEQGGWSKTHSHAIMATTMIERYSFYLVKITIEKYTNTASNSSASSRNIKNNRNRQSYSFNGLPQRKNTRPSYTADMSKSMSALL